MLTKVTITGADDNVKIDDLLALSEEFPFVEWGTLFSIARMGTARYPSGSWLVRFYDRMACRRAGRASMHFCGESAKLLMRGALSMKLPPLPDAPQSVRMQINGFRADDLAPNIDAVRQTIAAAGAEIILQVRAEDQIVPGAEIARQLGLGTSLLWDPSGGRGVESHAWPRPPIDVHMGYAGGIKPSNIIDVIRAIGVVDPPYWLDMESGVRDERDQFDLGLVREVLQKAAPFVVRPSAASDGASP
ncbi:MAG: hypothetical protein ACHREM_02315 [Polyangiales bacterium]